MNRTLTDTQTAPPVRNPIPAGKRLLMPCEAADVLGAGSERALRRFQNDPTDPLPVVRLGHRTKRYLLDDLLRWAEGRRTGIKIVVSTAAQRRAKGSVS
jgi:hypothetical protein